MELGPGQVLSHFRVAEKVGEGGMGVVYRALDLHLHRDVALKVISARAISAPNAQERFRKEALALSRLNHPNIAAIYDFDTEDGITFLVMEWISGTNVDTRLLRGTIPEAEILETADQVASGLAYAHAMGVVHRDLKPGNLRIADDGRIKILDFGLAKLWAPISDSAITETLPGAPAVVGTLPYVAPELLSGQRASAVTDVYAFGAVLYEMATQQRAFPQSDPDVLALAILNEPPMPPRELRRDLSQDLEHVILKALEKKPERRYQTAPELRADLQRISSGLPLRIQRRRWRPSEWIRWVPAMAAVVLLLIVVGVGRKDTRPRGVPVMKALVTWPSLERSGRISPDGQWVSFFSDRGGREALWLQRVRGGQPTLLTEQPGMVNQLWSPDGESVAVLVRRGEEAFVQILPSFGGPTAMSHRLSSDFLNARLIRWIGSRLYLEMNRQALWRLDLPTGALQQLLSAESPEGIRADFDVRQDEKQIAFTVRKGNQLTVWLSDLAVQRPVLLTTGGYNDYAPRFGGTAGQYLFLSSDRGGQVDLWRMNVAESDFEQITFSPTAEYVEDVSGDLSLLTFREVRENAHLWMFDRGEHRQLTAESLRDWWPSISRDRGAVVLQRQKPRLEGLPFWDGQILLASFADFRNAASWKPVAEGVVGRLSPDRKLLAYVRAIPNRRYELWTKDLESAHPWLVSDRFNLPGFYPFPRDWVRNNLAWSSNGRVLYFIASAESGEPEIRSSDGEGSTRLLRSAAPGVMLSDLYVSADGKFLGYVQTQGEDQRVSEVRRYDTVSGSDQVVYSLTHPWKKSLHFRGFSSHGSMILLEATFNPDWTQNAAVLELAPSGAVRTIAVIERTFAGTPRVDAERSLLYFVRSGEDLVHNLYSLSLRDGNARKLSSNNIPGISFSGLEVAPDGTLLYVLQENNQDLWTIQFPR